MDIPLHLHKVLAYARSKLGAEIELWELTTSRLDPGYVSEPPRRWDLIFRLPEGNLETISIVQKFTHAGEARVMAALGEIKPAEAIPEVIDYGVEKHSPEGKPKHWFITPFYEGCPLTFEDEMPVEVIRTLAQVHTRLPGKLKPSQVWKAFTGWMELSSSRHSPTRWNPWKSCFHANRMIIYRWL